MSERHPYQSQLLECIALEIKEQEQRYRLDESVGLKQLKAKGLALHPIKIIRKYFGYADYPELEFVLPFGSEMDAFRPSSAIEFLTEGQEIVRGVFIGGDGRKGAVRLYAPEFPDWTEEKDVVIKFQIVE